MIKAKANLTIITRKDKKNDKYDQRKKGFKPSNFRILQKQPAQTKKQLARAMGEKPKDLH